jgi:hypothetical protein
MPQTTPTRPPIGPFVTAVLSTLLATGLLIAMAAGMKLTMLTCFSVLIPGMTFSATAIAVAMGWIFVSIGRHKLQPRWVTGCAVFIAITMLELLVLTYIASQS